MQAAEKTRNCPNAATSSLRSGCLFREALNHSRKKRPACLELFYRNEFVCLMRLRDVARAADHCRATCVLEVSGLGSVANDMNAVIASDASDQRFCGAVLFRHERRHVVERSEPDTGRRRNRLCLGIHFRHGRTEFGIQPDPSLHQGPSASQFRTCSRQQ